MSLLSRVSSVEQFNPGAFSPERGLSPAPEARVRKLSFNPVPGEWEPFGAADKSGGSPSRRGSVRDGSRRGSVRERQRRDSVLSVGGFEIPRLGRDAEPIGAFEVRKSKRVLQVAAAVSYCLLAAGIVFGYAAIKPVLVREKVYRNLCTQDELDQDVRVCFQQEIRLNLMFTTAAVGTNVAALPIGAILDNFGPKVCGLIGSVLLTIGSLLFAFAGQLEADVYIVGYLFLALGGPFIFISSFQLSNTFPKHSGFILALLTGAFDTSSAVFLLYRVIYQNTDGALKPKHFFLLYLVVPAFIFIVQILLMPSQSYETVGELLQHVDPAASTNDAYRDDQMDETTALLREEERLHRESVVDELTDLLGSKRGQKQVKAEAKKQEVSGVWGVLHGQTVVQQITSPWFILITLFTVIQMTRINYFVATIRAQYEVIFGSYEKAVAINEFFDVMLPLGGVLSIPFIGTILDRSSTLSIVITLVSIATTIGVLGILPYDWAAYANVILFTLYRPFYYTAVSDYSAKVFGFRTFGTVYGLIICLAGLFNFSQSLLDTLTHKTFHNDPRYVNVGLLGVALLVGVALAGWVGWKARGLRKEMLAQEAEEAEEWEDPVAPRGGVRGRQE